MRNLLFMATLICFSATTPASSQSLDQSSVPQAATAPASVSSIYKQPIYTPKDERIGDVEDILLSPDGQATAVIVNVRDFLGVSAENHVALPYKGLSVTARDNQRRITMEASREELKGLTTYNYDGNKKVWVANEAKKP